MGIESTRGSLLSRVRSGGDSESWREFDRTYRDLILRYCRRQGLQISDAEDVRQAVMIRLSKRLESFRYDPRVGRFRDYLRRCVRNEVLRYRAGLRPRGERFEGELELIPEERANVLDEEWEVEWRAHHLRRAMEKARTVFARRTMETFERVLAGESPDRIALGQGTSVDAVYKTKQRLREFLSERVSEQLEEEEFEERHGKGAR